MTIKTLRKISGLTQKEFSNKYDIPIRTLQRWEQNQSSPANYILKLLEKDICNDKDEIIKIPGDKIDYIYNVTRRQLINSKGIVINIEIKNIKKIKLNNLSIYCDVLFEKYNKGIKSFLEDCKYDETTDILWERFY